MTKKEAKFLVKEFEEKHNAYSISHLGYWKNNIPKDMYTRGGYWYYKDHKMSDILDIWIK